MRRINDELSEADLYELMLWEKIESGEIDKDAYVRILYQMRSHLIKAGRYLESKNKGKDCDG